MIFRLMLANVKASHILAERRVAPSARTQSKRTSGLLFIVQKIFFAGFFFVCFVFAVCQLDI